MAAAEVFRIFWVKHMAEQLHGLMIRDGKIVVSVTSTGCTKSEHFKLDVVDANGELAVTVFRTQPDFCKKVPFVIEMELDLPEQAQSAPFKVQNSFIKGPAWMPPE